MAWTKAKTAIVIGAAAILAVGTVTPVVVAYHHRIQNNSQPSRGDIFVSKTELSDDDMTKYKTQTGMTPLEVAQTLFDAFSKEDWTEADKYWPTDPRNPKAPQGFPDDFKQYVGGIKVINLGKPFRGRISAAKVMATDPRFKDPRFKNQLPKLPKEWDSHQVFVPYEIQFKNGDTKQYRLSIRCDNPQHRWEFDGGL